LHNARGIPTLEAFPENTETAMAFEQNGIRLASIIADK
jgi:hypothetical protein